MKSLKLFKIFIYVNKISLFLVIFTLSYGSWASYDFAFSIINTFRVFRALRQPSSEEALPPLEQLQSKELEKIRNNHLSTEDLQMQLAAATSQLEWIRQRLEDSHTREEASSLEAFDKNKQLREAVRQNDFLLQQLKKVTKEKEQLQLQLEELSDPLTTIPDEVIKYVSDHAKDIHGNQEGSPKLKKFINDVRYSLTNAQKKALLSWVSCKDTEQ